ncbi:MAG: hypothetical protein M3328_13100 [Chloroflexota bacterium]|nr:hypothetical protein [Chloroflexota bacterium]
MPPIDKAERRDRKRDKAHESKFLGVRYNALRAGQSLANFEAERKTNLQGKAAKRRKPKE